MCPMLPDHNFLVSGAEWPTEKHIKKFGPSFSIFLGNYIFSVLTLNKVQYRKCQISPNYGKTRAQFFNMFFSWPFCTTHQKIVVGQHRAHRFCVFGCDSVLGLVLIDTLKHMQNVVLFLIIQLWFFTFSCAPPPCKS